MPARNSCWAQSGSTRHTLPSPSPRCADDTCYPDNGLGLARVRAVVRNHTVEVRSRADSLATHPALRVASGQLGQLNDYACGAETQMGAWLESAAVQK